MTQYRRWTATFISACSLVLTIVIWAIFAPCQLGGQSTYVILDGSSMEPGYHYGDLVIIHAAPIYRVGDVVIYRDLQLGAYVFHRIVGQEQNRFILKGDNNSWVDSYQPAADEIIGKLWIDIPRAGQVILDFRTPINLALATGALGGIWMADFVVGKDKKKGKRMRKQAAKPGGALEWAFFVLGFVAFASLLLSIYSFTRPPTLKPKPVEYVHMGTFFYAAPAPAGIYDSDKITSGEPIFTELTCSVDIGFIYVLAGSQITTVSGAMQVYARVSDEQSGWQRIIPLITPQVPFSGTSFESHATLDLCQIEALVDAMEQQTGFHSTYYRLDVISDISVAITTAEQELTDRFAPVLTFRFDKLHFFVAADDIQTDPFRSSQKGFVVGPVGEPYTLSLFGWKLAIESVRVFSLTLLLLSLVALLFLGLFVWDATRRSEHAMIQFKYRPILIDIFDRNVDTLSPAVEVTSIEDLSKLADRHNTVILHTVRNQLHYYLVQNNGITYRYVVND